MPPSRPESTRPDLDITIAYKDDVGEVDLLSAEQEVYLGMAKEAGERAEKQLLKSNGELSEDERKDLLAKVKDGKKAKDHLTEANLRLVLKNAARYISDDHTLDYLDLVQEGNIGLMRAVDKFDYRKGFKFSTYATWWIRQALTRAIANDGRAVRIPVHMTETIYKAKKVMGQLEAKLGRKPTLAEIAEEAGLSKNKVEQAFDIQNIVSTEQPVGEDGAVLGDFIEDEGADDPEESTLNAIATEEQYSYLAEVLELAGLNPREKQILTWRYGLDGDEPKTLEEVGELYKLTRERIRQLEQKALTKLRPYYEQEGHSDHLKSA